MSRQGRRTSADFYYSVQSGRQQTGHQGKKKRGKGSRSAKPASGDVVFRGLVWLVVVRGPSGAAGDEDGPTAQTRYAWPRRIPSVGQDGPARPMLWYGDRSRVDPVLCSRRADEEAKSLKRKSRPARSLSKLTIAVCVSDFIDSSTVGAGCRQSDGVDAQSAMCRCRIPTAPCVRETSHGPMEE